MRSAYVSLHLRIASNLILPLIVINYFFATDTKTNAHMIIIYL